MSFCLFFVGCTSQDEKMALNSLAQVKEAIEKGNSFQARVYLEDYEKASKKAGIYNKKTYFKNMGKIITLEEKERFKRKGKEFLKFYGDFFGKIKKFAQEKFTSLAKEKLAKVKKLIKKDDILAEFHLNFYESYAKRAGTFDSKEYERLAKEIAELKK